MVVPTCSTWLSFCVAWHGMPTPASSGFEQAAALASGYFLTTRSVRCCRAVAAHLMSLSVSLAIVSSSLFSAFSIVRFPPTHIQHSHTGSALGTCFPCACVSVLGGGWALQSGMTAEGHSELAVLGAHCARQLSGPMSSDCMFGSEHCLLGFWSWGGIAPAHLALRAHCMRAVWLPRLGNGFL